MAMFIFYILPMAPIKPLCQNYVAGNGALRLSESKILVFTIWDSPGGPVVKTPWIQSLIRKLRSNMPCGLAKKINKLKKIKYLLSGSLQKKLANPWFQFSSVQSLSHVRLLRPYESQHDRPPCPSPTPEFTQLMSIESVMSSTHLILCHPLLLLPSIFPSIRVFSNESVRRIRWPKY